MTAATAERKKAPEGAFLLGFWHGDRQRMGVAIAMAPALATAKPSQRVV